MARREASFFCLLQFSHNPFPTLRILLPDSNRSPQAISLAKRLCPCNTRWVQGCGACKRWKQSPTNLVSRYRTLFLRFRRARRTQRLRSVARRSHGTAAPCTSEVSVGARFLSLEEAKVFGDQKCRGSSWEGDTESFSCRGEPPGLILRALPAAAPWDPCPHPRGHIRAAHGASPGQPQPSTGTAGRFP